MILQVVLKAETRFFVDQIKVEIWYFDILIL